MVMKRPTANLHTAYLLPFLLFPFAIAACGPSQEPVADPSSPGHGRKLDEPFPEEGLHQGNSSFNHYIAGQLS